MFDFTTENILNDLSRVSTIDHSTDPGLAVGDKALFIKRLNKFKSSSLIGLYKSAGYNPVKEVATIAVPSVVSGLAGSVYRLHVDIVLSGGSQDGDYSRWAVFKGKPLYAEYLVVTDPANQDAFGAALAASWEKVLKRQGVDQVTITYDATGNNIVVTAINEYQRFVYSALEVLDQTNFDGDYNVVALGTVSVAGKEGFGTSWFLTKNIRLPTLENLRFMGENQDEKPIEGALYNQYTIQYKTQRNIGGQGAVGEKNSSTTTHVLYVLQTLASTFEANLATVFGTSALVDGTTGAPVAFSALADIVYTTATVSAATAVAGTYAGSFQAFHADLTPATTGVTYSLVAGTGSTDNALFEITGSQLRTAGTVTTGSKAFRVAVTDANGTYQEAFTITIAA